MTSSPPLPAVTTSSPATAPTGVRVLAISDEVEQLIYSDRIKERFAHVDLVLSCGDLPTYYLEFIVSSLNVPLYGDIGIYLSSPSHPTDPNTLFLRLSSRLDIETRFLDGRISLFGEVGPFPFEVAIFSWTGFGGKVNLYNESKSFPLARVF